MRRDMSKVIVERPRWGSRMRMPRRFHRLDPRLIAVDEDGCDPFPSRIGHKAAASLAKRRKMLNENLAPLRRFLMKQAGRPWNDVWSEISENLRPTSTVQQHVRDHVEDFVAIRTFLHHGEIYFDDRWRGPRPLAHRWNAHLLLYVDPQTGILRRNTLRGAWKRAEHAERQKALAEQAMRLRILDDGRRLVLLDDGNWWEVTLAVTPTRFSTRQVNGMAFAAMPAVDVVERAGLSTLPRADRYGVHGMHAVAKRPLSRRELKEHKLRE